MQNHELYNSVWNDQEKLYAANPSRMVGNNHLSSHYQTDFQQQQLARSSLISSNNGHWSEGENGNNDMRLLFSQVSTIKNKNQFPLILIDVTAIQMKEEEERSKIEKGKEGATVDLMQGLLASTKEVKEQNDGFVDVVKKTKGNNGFFFKRSYRGGGGKQFLSLWSAS
ncbi:unnamed protein product [Lactuca saligna]|uniref:Uncharacterized protein n=1 Tax=Lactuca saligna TaxID=75948 RepID=A0AA35YQT1_LACSI|nr:unnamed protein product [Lactuca saligna]